jgi:3-hydroxyisobutyrate dehydrogenase-like beta-hydroxyacid dehydrogenase
MGAPIARRLLAAGHQVTVWNRTQARAVALVAAGARSAASPVEAVGDADVVITMLTDATAVETVLFGPGGAATALRTGAVVVDMSTIGPAAVAELARRLPVDLVDAPIGGSVAAAEAGRLMILTGGDKSIVDSVVGVLEALGTVRRCGGSGTGAALKLVLNAALVTGLAALADTLSVADAVGVDRSTALDVLAAGPLRGAVDRANASGSAFSVALASKDMDLVRGELGDADAPVIDAAARLLGAAPDQTADIATILTRE